MMFHSSCLHLPAATKVIEIITLPRGAHRKPSHHRFFFSEIQEPGIHGTAFCRPRIGNKQTHSPNSKLPMRMLSKKRIKKPRTRWKTRMNKQKAKEKAGAFHAPELVGPLAQVSRPACTQLLHARLCLAGPWGLGPGAPFFVSRRGCAKCSQAHVPGALIRAQGRSVAACRSAVRAPCP